MGEGEPKYLNSPESPIFNKRRLLFAIYQALPEIRQKRQAIMVEGYMDAISLHAHGVTNVVASLGTASPQLLLSVNSFIVIAYPIRFARNAQEYAKCLKVLSVYKLRGASFCAAALRLACQPKKAEEAEDPLCR